MEGKVQVKEPEVIRPQKFLVDNLGREIVCILKTGQTVMGLLCGYDNHLNLTLLDYRLIGSNMHMKPSRDQPVLLRGDTILMMFSKVRP